MRIVLSPAKSLNFSSEGPEKPYSEPQFVKEAEVLVGVLKKYSAKRLGKLMKINPKLSQLNFERFQAWDSDQNEVLGRHALQSFRGDVYLGIDAPSLSADALMFAQEHLRILSGLYGILRPLDLIQPYRLEMGAAVKYRRKKNLYEYWGDKIASYLLEEVRDSGNVLVNLASQEYFKVLDKHVGNVDVITPVFKDFKNGEYKFIHVFGKKARGLMTRFIIDNRITDPERMKLFDYEGYFYNDRMSTGNEWVFTRG